MDIPKIDLKELRRQKRQNFKERLEFIDCYVEWLKTRQRKGASSTGSP